MDAATVSPSGTWIAYVSTQTGNRDVYVRPVSGPGREQRVSEDGGNHPAWGDSDSVLIYTSPSGDTWTRASLEFEPLRVTERLPLFTSNAYWGSIRRADYDVAADGRLLMLRQIGGGSQLRVVENWFAELLERLGN